MDARLTAIACGLVAFSGAALAQQSLSVRLKAGDRNPSACTAGDPAMSRPQTVTVANNVATIKSNGGINDRAKMASPGVYKTRWSMSGITYDIEINTNSSPATMTVTEPKLGCKWTGQAA